MATFDWPNLLRAGIHQLGLKPAEFWQLTPAELEVMMGPGFEEMCLSRSGFERLMQTFPDGVEGSDNG